MVRKVSLILVVLVVLPMSIVRAQELTQSPLQGVLMGSLWNDDHFSKPINAGMKAGVLVPFDIERGMGVRLVYAKWQLREEEESQSITATFMIDWYLGKKWTFYTTLFGAESYVAGPITGTDFFTGLGASRRIWTDDAPGYKVPFYMDLFADITLSKDADWQATPTDRVDDYVQINVGVKFGRPIKS